MFIFPRRGGLVRRNQMEIIKKMGERQQHHQATDNLVNLLTKANHDLTSIQFKLEKEFHQVYPHNANPMRLVSRIKKMEEELTSMKEQCRELLAAKQELIDKARTCLVGNRNLVQRMRVSLGDFGDPADEDSAFDNFNQVIDEWTNQVRTVTGDEMQHSDSQDVNKLLFSAIVPSN